MTGEQPDGDWWARPYGVYFSAMKPRAYWGRWHAVLVARLASRLLGVTASVYEPGLTTGVRFERGRAVK